jgi:aquaporin Z
MIDAFKAHWRLYLYEATLLGLFMISASFFTVLFEYPQSPVHQSMPNGFARLCLIALAMGATATALIYSPFGKQSGAHFNPAVTLTMLRLGKLSPADALFYTLFQTIGGTGGVLFSAFVLRDSFTALPINYIVTVPNGYSEPIVFAVEFAIAFGMMTMVQVTSNHAALSRFTGVFAGMLVVCYVVVSGPISGFGMNPARTLASAIPAMRFDGLWIYIVAPPLGMLAATEVYLRLRQWL